MPNIEACKSFDEISALGLSYYDITIVGQQATANIR